MILTTLIVSCFRGVDYFDTCRGIRRSSDCACSEQVLGFTSCPSNPGVPNVSFFPSAVTHSLTPLDSHQWMFVTDTVDAIYRPEYWSPESLLDQLAELVRDLPEPKVCQVIQLGDPSYLSPRTRRLQQSRQKPSIPGRLLWRPLGPLASRIRTYDGPC